MAAVSKAEAVSITNDIRAAVEDILKRYGYDSPSVKTTYGDVYKVTIQSTPVVEGSNGINLNAPEVKAYQQYARWTWVTEFGGYTLDPDAIGKTYTIRGEEFVLVGLAPKNRKYPFLFRKVADGKTYKFDDNAVRHIGTPASGDDRLARLDALSQR